MVDPSKFFESGQTACARCGQVNDLGSSEALYWADDSRRCEHCGFLFIRHKNRQMAKTMEMLKTDPEWTDLIRAGRIEEVKRRLDKLVPLEEEDSDRMSSEIDGNANG
jgi:DNA-directed RNA polymerase subunit RPC12/RpoP